jgi:hypothetical protein
MGNLVKTLLVFVLCCCYSRVFAGQINAIATLTNNVESIDSFSATLDQVVDQINASDKYDNIIIFIHGRGKHPEKAFKQSILSDLESDYSAKVIMFHWPSWTGKFSFPTKKARKSAADFSRLLKDLYDYKCNNRDKIKHIKFTLFVNSMGSIVLEESINQNKQKPFPQLFDTLIINASASASKNHTKWVDKISLSNDIYITINNRDKLLNKIGVALFGKRLGKGLISIFGNKFKLTTHVKYIDLSQSDLSHRYYLNSHFNDKLVAKLFFERVLNGLPAYLDFQHGMQKIKNNNIYMMRKNP